ncbi:MAG TPA: hypothetical protein VMP03_03770 [Methylomirabilota bacterium]|nr:hypothetical protein [Methylomirabilota bacterium]
MAKGQTRGNKEARKPKSKKVAVAAPVGLIKGITVAAAMPKKKG